MFLIVVSSCSQSKINYQEMKGLAEGFIVSGDYSSAYAKYNTIYLEYGSMHPSDLYNFYVLANKLNEFEMKSKLEYHILSKCNGSIRNNRTKKIFNIDENSKYKNEIDDVFQLYLDDQCFYSKDSMFCSKSRLNSNVENVFVNKIVDELIEHKLPEIDKQYLSETFFDPIYSIILLHSYNKYIKVVDDFIIEEMSKDRFDKDYGVYLLGKNDKELDIDFIKMYNDKLYVKDVSDFVRDSVDRKRYQYRYDGISEVLKKYCFVKCNINDDFSFDSVNLIDKGYSKDTSVLNQLIEFQNLRYYECECDE